MRTGTSGTVKRCDSTMATSYDEFAFSYKYQKHGGHLGRNSALPTERPR